MAGEEEVFETCADCGATVYPEHIQRNMAERLDGKLLCAHCLRNRRSPVATAPAVGAPPPAPGQGAVMGEPIAVAGVGTAQEAAAEPLIEYDRKPTAVRSLAASVTPLGEGFSLGTHKLRRPLLTGVPAATRCRVFHCKLADGAFGHMMEQLNEWADSDDSIEIKFATSCIGVVEGKHSDPHLIVTVFY